MTIKKRLSAALDVFKFMSIFAAAPMFLTVLLYLAANGNTAHPMLKQMLLVNATFVAGTIAITVYEFFRAK